MRPEDAWELNQWCSSSDCRPLKLRQAVECLYVMQRERNSLYRFHTPTQTEINAINAKIAAAECECDRLGDEWEISLRASHEMVHYPSGEVVAV